MQDEVNEKAIMLSIKCTKLTARLLQKAIKLLVQIKKQIDKPLPITHWNGCATD